MKTQQEYWENQIIDWENGTYHLERNRKTPLIERIAENFRETVKNRPEILYQIIRETKPQTVIEFGCGSGQFIIRLLKDQLVQKAIAVDISSQAIAFAKKAAEAQGVSDKVTFIQSSVSDFDFDQYLPADFVYGLGLTPYLTESEMTLLFSKIAQCKFFFDVHPAGVNVVNFLHIFYMAIRQHAFYRKFSQKDILSRMQAWGINNVQWHFQNKVHYFTKLK